MTRRFCGDASGSAALEFALVAPLFLAFVFGGLALGTAVWQRNILQNVALDTARCVSLRASPCMKAAEGCAAGAGQCYAVQRARKRGLRALRESQVTVDAAAVVDNASFTTVALSYPLILAGYSIALTASASFPNED